MAARESDYSIVQEQKIVLSKQEISNTTLAKVDLQVSRNLLTELKESEYIYGGETEKQYLAA